MKQRTLPLEAHIKLGIELKGMTRQAQEMIKLLSETYPRQDDLKHFAVSAVFDLEAACFSLRSILEDLLLWEHGDDNEDLLLIYYGAEE